MVRFVGNGAFFCLRAARVFARGRKSGVRGNRDWGSSGHEGDGENKSRVDKELMRQSRESDLV